ncbi:4a-hydroxytetrahydrobiopterin dehydratase [Neorhizobium lilium]|uniref:Putative pterin-4-alpha-carbinolamine dehydratase n=1 Tax=Neorhizobium lilium TaxID=2503024 RepID=A0A3S3VF27_9HYPH|nr:4a-hydroxytetrahydrobiopterin dehydratase [Neorhizobium lilium]RWX75124.1 4a-hydroxytetrahydrobiopterin dehydratase [Neorhizobium lilium]
MAYRLLDPAAVERELTVLDGWVLSADGKAIGRDFAFRSFIEAFAFMTRCALVAEKLDHHPDWSNSYSKVQVSLTTHVVKALTDRDFKLASAMDAAFRGRD